MEYVPGSFPSLKSKKTRQRATDHQLGADEELVSKHLLVRQCGHDSVLDPRPLENYIRVISSMVESEIYNHKPSKGHIQLI